eukprot:GSA120T00005213001.1
MRRPNQTGHPNVYDGALFSQIFRELDEHSDLANEVAQAAAEKRKRQSAQLGVHLDTRELSDTTRETSRFHPPVSRRQDEKPLPALSPLTSTLGGLNHGWSHQMKSPVAAVDRLKLADLLGAIAASHVRRKVFQMTLAHLTAVRFVGKLALDLFRLFEGNIARAAASRRGLAFLGHLRGEMLLRSGSDDGRGILGVLESGMKKRLEELLPGSHMARILLVMGDYLVVAPFTAMVFVDGDSQKYAELRSPSHLLNANGTTSAAPATTPSRTTNTATTTSRVTRHKMAFGGVGMSRKQHVFLPRSRGFSGYTSRAGGGGQQRVGSFSAASFHTSKLVSSSASHVRAEGRYSTCFYLCADTRQYYHERGAFLDPEVDGAELCFSKHTAHTLDDVHFLSAPVFLSPQVAGKMLEEGSHFHSEAVPPDVALLQQKNQLLRLPLPPLHAQKLQPTAAVVGDTTSADRDENQGGEGGAAGNSVATTTAPPLTSCASGMSNIQHDAFAVVQILSYRRPFSPTDVDNFQHAVDVFSLSLESALLSHYLDRAEFATLGE